MTFLKSGYRGGVPGPSLSRAYRRTKIAINETITIRISLRLKGLWKALTRSKKWCLGKKAWLRKGGGKVLISNWAWVVPMISKI
jgi:hypothetical protein